MTTWNPGGTGMKYEHKVLDEGDPRTLGIKLNQLENEG